MTPSESRHGCEGYSLCAGWIRSRDSARVILSHAPTDNPRSSARWVCSTISRTTAKRVLMPYCIVTKPGPCKSADVSTIAPTGSVTKRSLWAARETAWKGERTRNCRQTCSNQYAFGTVSYYPSRRACTTRKFPGWLIPFRAARPSRKPSTSLYLPVFDCCCL